MKRFQKYLCLIPILGLTLTLATACKEKGEGEKLGERIDKQAEKTKDAVKDATK